MSSDNSPDNNPKVSPTAQITPDVVGLGQTSGQRTAEIFAGLRAELMNTPEVNALSRFSGRIFARIISALATPKVLNFVTLRLNGFIALSREALANGSDNPVLVDTAAGFAPRGILLAKEMPHLKVIEVDLPGVIEEKQRRLHAAHIDIPPNLEWRHADLGVTPLSEVLDGQQVDVITSEGLLHYFSYDEITVIAKHFYQSLKPGGSFISDIGYRNAEGQRETSGIISFFSRKTQSNPSKGVVTKKETAEDMFVKADYDPIVIYSMPEISEKYNLAKPAPDYLFFVHAIRPMSDAPTTSETSKDETIPSHETPKSEAPAGEASPTPAPEVVTSIDEAPSTGDVVEETNEEQAED